MSPTAACSVLTLAATALLVAAEARRAKRAIWIWKPLASAGFVATALAAGAPGGGYGATILLGLVLCALGDVLLIPDDDRALRAGMGAFLLGHVAFFAAFAGRGLAAGVLIVTLAAMVVPARAIVRWLLPHVTSKFRSAIIAYTSVISVMVAGAAATFAHEPSWTILTGALGFMLSDLSVARDRFVAAELVNRAWGLPLYYGAQLLLAQSIRFAATPGA